MKKLFLFIIGLFPIVLLAQMPKAESGTFALTNAQIETVTNGTIAKGTVIISNGRITAVGENVATPAGATVIDCSGKHIYPGFIDSGTRLGLSEIGSLPETQDNRELGDFAPNMHALTAINPNSVSIPITRTNGVTTVLSMPTGGMFPGQAAVVNLHGYTPQQMHTGFEGVILDFPTSAKRGWWDDRKPEKIKEEYQERLLKLDDIWQQAERFAMQTEAANADKNLKAPEYYPEMAALTDVVTGKAPLMIEVNMAPDIKDALAWVKANNVQAIFMGVSEGWRVAEQIAAANIPVITGPVLNLPTRDADRYDRPYANAGLMSAAGVQVAIRTAEAENVRNLPFHAGFATTYGLPRQKAIEAITIVPARIFGLDKDYGSIEVGKVANLLVANGDPLETRTQVEHVFIAGKKMPNYNRHIGLYEEFLKRDPGLSRE